MAGPEGEGERRCTVEGDGGRGRREMQRNASLLCDGLTPANQTADAEDK